MNREIDLAIIGPNNISQRIREILIENQNINIITVSESIKDISSELSTRLRDMPRLFSDKVDVTRPIPKYKRKKK